MLALPVRRAEDVSLWRHHHVVEVLREHRRREKCDRAQCFSLQRFCEKLGHVFWPDIREIGDLVPATCARGDDLCAGGLIVDLIEQALRDLER